MPAQVHPWLHQWEEQNKYSPKFIHLESFCTMIAYKFMIAAHNLPKYDTTPGTKCTKVSLKMSPMQVDWTGGLTQFFADSNA